VSAVMNLQDVAVGRVKEPELALSVGPGKYCSPRLKMPFKSRIRI